MTATMISTRSIADAADLSPSESRIDADSHFNGLYQTRQNLRIEGVAEGEIQCEGTLTVAEGARVKAKVTASTITIAGALQGEVICQGVFQIMPSGEVEASVSARRLIVQEGGLYNGDFRMITDDIAPRVAARANQTAVTESRARRRATPIEAEEETPPPASAAAPDAAGTEAIGSDEWWARISGRDAAAGASDEDTKPA